MSAPITLPAFAKVNLSLRVLGKRADGYHTLDTVFQTISLHDTISFAVIDGPEIIFSCDDRSLPQGAENLIVRAARAFQNHLGVGRGARIHLTKRIPTQAGLGGGSSDAAVTLLALARLWKLELSRESLLELAATLGADVPFFLFGGTARGRGIGNEIDQLPDAAETFFLIVKPNANISTSDAYHALDQHSLTSENAKTILSSSEAKAFFESFDHLQNDFEAVAFQLEPEIERAKISLMNAGARGALLAGSGSAVFGVFDSEDAQRRAIQAIELETGWRVFPCKTVGRDEYQAAMGF